MQRCRGRSGGAAGCRAWRGQCLWVQGCRSRGEGAEEGAQGCSRGEGAGRRKGAE